MNIVNMRSVGQRASKLLAVKVGVRKKKSVALVIPAKLCASMFSLGSSSPRVESLLKFDGHQLCRPLIYRLHISSIERSKTFVKWVKISRGW